MSRSTRPSIHDTMLGIARLLSQRSTCYRRMVGCVLVDKHNHVIATGYNGVAAGQKHCIEVPCRGSLYSSGDGLDLCEAIHAEQNALLQVKDMFNIMTAYCTTAPCVTCVKLLMNTSCQTIMFLEDYPHAEEAKRLWTTSFISSDNSLLDPTTALFEKRRWIHC